ncbi:MAG: glycosyltransferase family 4 protein [bacterium]|nr:glycosyltransferase family 4 protein [bacterium]
MKIALVHDFLAEWGGAERVVLALHHIFPKAPLYTAFYLPNRLGQHNRHFQNLTINTSFLQKIPAISRLYSPLRLWALLAFEQLDFSQYDVVISSSNMYMAKGVICRPQTLHVSYLHSIPKYLYGYTTAQNWRQTLAGKLIAPYLNHRMRFLDFVASQRPDVLVANSKETRKRIFKAYKRDALVVYPPVDIPAKPPAAAKRDFILVVSRLVLAKHVDLAIKLAQKYKLKLKIVGAGPDLPRLKSLAGPETCFLGSVSDDRLHTLYAQAQALIFPSEDEDFGIVPIEAQAHGTPVIAHASGGSLETVIDGQTGLLFKDLTLESLSKAWQKFQTIRFDPLTLYNHTQKFSFDVFKTNITNLIQKHYDRSS